MGANRVDVRGILRLLVIFVAAFVILVWTAPIASYAEESSCISCHTSTKKLLKVIRDIEASKPKVEASTESEGEG